MGDLELNLLLNLSGHISDQTELRRRNIPTQTADSREQKRHSKNCCAPQTRLAHLHSIRFISFGIIVPVVNGQKHGFLKAKMPFLHPNFAYVVSSAQNHSSQTC